MPLLLATLTALALTLLLRRVLLRRPVTAGHALLLTAAAWGLAVLAVGPLDQA